MRQHFFPAITQIKSNAGFKKKLNINLNKIIGLTLY